VHNSKFTLAAIALGAALAGGGALTLPSLPAAAQAQSPATPPSANPPARPHREFRSHIDGRIAFLKAEIKITPDQEAQWAKVAQVLRDDSAERRKAFEDMRGAGGANPPPRTALQRLEGEARMSTLRAQQSSRFLAAFRPLYDSLSDEQKKAADDVMAPHGHHFGHRRG
jgi:periplasmic protein CpxP/Spy